MHKNNKHQNQGVVSGLGRVRIREGYRGEIDCICKTLFIKLGNGYICAIIQKKKDTWNW